jgi:uncharacterized protein (TIGR03086 family)
MGVTADETALLRQALDGTGRLLTGVDPARYGDPTPCPGWDVRTLVNHLVGGNRYFTVRASGGEPEFAWFAEDYPDPTGTWQEWSAKAVEVWSAPDTPDPRAPLPSGGLGPRIFTMHLMEIAAHGWDLADATGQPRPDDPELVDALFDLIYGTIPDELRASGRVVGPEIDCPDDAPTLHRLLAYLGRQP